MTREETALVRQPVSRKLEFGPGEAESLKIFMGTQSVPVSEIVSPSTQSGGEKKYSGKYVDFSRMDKPGVRAGLRALADFCRGCQFGQPLVRYEKGLAAALENKAGKSGSPVKTFSLNLYKVGSSGGATDPVVARIVFRSDDLPEVFRRNEGEFQIDLLLTDRLRSMLQAAGIFAEVQTDAS